MTSERPALAAAMAAAAAAEGEVSVFGGFTASHAHTYTHIRDHTCIICASKKQASKHARRRKAQQETCALGLPLTSALRICKHTNQNENKAGHTIWLPVLAVASGIFSFAVLNVF